MISRADRLEFWIHEWRCRLGGAWRSLCGDYAAPSRTGIDELRRKVLAHDFMNPTRGQKS